MMKRNMLILFTLTTVLITPFCKVFAVTLPTFYAISGSNEGRFLSIGKSAIDSFGNIYISDYGNDRIQQFDGSGNFIKFIGGNGITSGKFRYPLGVAVDSLDCLYVADAGNRRIQKFDRDGNFVSMFPTVYQPRDVDFDSDGYIYVLEGNYLGKYDSQGANIWRIAGDFDRPEGLAVDVNNTIYVADTWHHIVKKFDPAGNALGSIIYGNDAIYDVDVDQNGLIYVSLHYASRIDVLSSEGVFIKSIPAGYYAVSVTADFAGNIFITTLEDHLIKIAPDGNQVLTIGSNGSKNTEFAVPKWLAKDTQGNIYISDEATHNRWWDYSSYSTKLVNHRIRKIDREGNITLTFGQNGNNPADFRWGPADLAVDSVGDIFVDGLNSPTSLSEVKHFDASGTYLDSFQVFEGNMGNLSSGMAFDSNENFFISDGWTAGTIIKFTKDGQKQNTYSYGGYAAFYDLEVDFNDNIVAVNGHGHNLYKFDNNGDLILKLTPFIDQKYITSYGLDTDEEGNIWVADTNNQRILCFSSDGSFLFQFGQQGFGPGEFQFPYDVAVSNGRVFVSDTYNQRIQIFSFNEKPEVNAGENLTVASEDQPLTILQGYVFTSNSENVNYRWKEGTKDLSSWQTVGPEGEAFLDLAGTENLAPGEHTLILEAINGQVSSTDEMILTISNSVPHAAPVGSGTYEIFMPVILAGQVSDFDGDSLSYQWLNDELVLESGQIQAIYGGDPSSIPESATTFSTSGSKVITLLVSDGVNPPVLKNLAINVIDSTAPTLAPIPDRTILWPANHKMVEIHIQANASDNSGNPVTLTVSIAANEPIEGLDDEDMTPDWTQPVIDQQTGEITLQVRAERSGSGSGRVYTITITATDLSGNASTTDVKIVVPHDNRKK